MKKILLFTVILLFFVQFFLLTSKVNAQFQDGDFSANDPQCSSYRCPEKAGLTSTLSYNNVSEFCECEYSNGEVSLALIKPPALQQIEIWFVRIVYAIWAFVGSLSFLLLVYLGYQWILTRGDVTKITEIRQRIINYAIGTAFIFLALPILTTFFRLLGVNGEVQCYKFDTLPRFQFFFPELCTDPLDLIVSDPCNFTISAEGYACSVPGSSYECSAFGGVTNYRILYYCNSNNFWERRIEPI